MALRILLNSSILFHIIWPGLRAEHDNMRKDILSGADPGFFLGGAAPLRNGIVDW